MSQEKQSTKEKSFSSFTAKLEEYVSSSGRPYFGVTVPVKILKPHLHALKKHVGTEAFNAMAKLKAQRDGEDSFHITLARPTETTPETIERMRGLLGTPLTFDCFGVGFVQKEVEGKNNKAYYVIVQSKDAHILRESASLPPFTFHITLGFQGADVHDVSKGPETQIFVPRKLFNF